MNNNGFAYGAAHAANRAAAAYARADLRAARRDLAAAQADHARALAQAAARREARQRAALDALERAVLEDR